MGEGIRVGDWISYPVSAGRQTGKVLSVSSDVYDVRVKVGSGNYVVTVVAKGEKVKKEAPPEEE